VCEGFDGRVPVGSWSGGDLSLRFLVRGTYLYDVDLELTRWRVSEMIWNLGRKAQSYLLGISQ